ncbi:MAG TPA: hypothetical protein P5567_04950 [Kiritimatiellia bacterium]|nr:hypothetical protein [Kiritimatiellia bacterium]HRZ11785.1 hypothetical protein [Kiritimatiellia bacterium]HSA17409.1 hypothetical protein [Kiritimatiellia bacterium]
MSGAALHKMGFLALLLGMAGGSAPGVEVILGEDRALVREVRTLALAQGLQTVVLDNLPSGIDLDTLTLRARRVDLELRGWALDGGTGVAAEASGEAVWPPAAASAPAGERPAGPVSVRAQVYAPDERRALEVEVAYRTSGLNWSAAYQVVVRGDRVEEREPLSADLTGWVRIQNRAGVAFTNAAVRLVGRRVPEEEGRPPGFLMLDEVSPMSDLWRWRPPEADIEYEYALPDPVDLPAGSAREFTLVKSARVPAARRYVLRAEEFSASLEAPPQPLRKYIIVRNIAANRLGLPLPPGPVQLFLGSMRSQLLQTGDLPHTPVDGDIRIDLGPSPDVTGRRGRQARAERPEGGEIETFAIEVLNGRDGAITVELDEKPPLILQWALVSSTRPCREVFRRLRYELDLPAGGRETVEYTVRVSRPSL